MNKKPQSKNNKKYYMYGKHSVLAALNNTGRQIHEIYTDKAGAALIPTIFKDKLKILAPSELSKIAPKDAVHQNFIALVTMLPNSDVNLSQMKENAKIAILDQITDPHNFGAILRSAKCFDIDLVILPQDNSSDETAIVAKSACGALDMIPILRVTNLATTMELIKKNNFWIIGLDGHSNSYLDSKLLSGKTAIVLGSEGIGMRRLTKEKCDLLAKIPMDPSMESLNVSNAAAIAFYEAFLAKSK